MLVTLVVAVVGITVSNLPTVGASGSVTGSGSSMASRLSWSIGALAAIAFLVLCVATLRARRTTRR